MIVKLWRSTTFLKHLPSVQVGSPQNKPLYSKGRATRLGKHFQIQALVAGKRADGEAAGFETDKGTSVDLSSNQRG